MDPRNTTTKPGSTVLDGRYILKEKVGNGSFGQIHIAVSKEDGTVVAIKLERKIANAIMTLAREAKILKELRGEIGFPTVHDYGTDNSYNYLVIDLLGLDLEKLFKSCNYKFSLKTSLLVAEQMLTRIESFHKKGYIHRDIKPENFCISKGSNGELHLIDFGLARSYKDIHGKHITCSQKKGLIGTARYASINNHLGLEQSRRDDLEAIGYTMIYLMKGQLPWQNLKASTKQEKYEMIANLKLTTPIPVLCKDLPAEFLTYMNYVRSLDFVETPDYKYLKGLFRALFLKSGFDYDYGYDWLRFKKKEDPGSLDKLPKKPIQGTAENKITMSPSKEHIIFETNLPAHLHNLAQLQLAQRPKPSGVSSNQRQPRPSIEYSPYKLIVSKEFIDSNGDLADRNDTQNKIIGDLKQFISKTHGKINGFTSREDNQSKTNFLYSENSPRNISTSSEHSSKMINVSKTKFEDDDGAFDIPIELTGDIPTPSAKIKETTPLKAKTKNSYYQNGVTQDCLQPGTAREDVRKRTFIRTYSARPSTSTDSAAMKKKVIAPPPVIKERLPVPREEIKLETEDQGENLNESSIGEWAAHSPMNQMMNQRTFITNNKNF